MKWQLIGTAPKDGEDILCYDKGTFIICHWSDFEDDGTSWCTHAFGREKGWNDYNGQIHNPTHWMPLPTEPI